MNRFVNGKADEYKPMKSVLDNGGEFNFDNILLPETCSPRVINMLFYKEDGKYSVMIDNCITSETNNLAFNQFVNNGGRTFDSFDDMMEFFHSLKDVFANTPSHRSEVYLEKMDAFVNKVQDLVEVNNNRRFSKPLKISCLNLNGDTLMFIAERLKVIMSARYGHDYGVIKFEGVPFGGENTIYHLYDVDRYTKGISQIMLLNRVRHNPYQIIVVDNIERLNDKTRSLLLLGAKRGSVSLKSDFRPLGMEHCLFLFGTGARVDVKKYDAASSDERVKMCRNALSEKLGNTVIAKEFNEYVVF